MWCGDMYEVSQLGSIFFATLELNEKRQRYCKTSERWPESCLILCVCARACGHAALSMFVCLTNDRLSGWIGAMAAVMENTVVVIAVGLRQ